MSDEKKPMFVFNVGVPVYTPEVGMVAELKERGEPFLKHLLSSGYLTEEELASYVSFILNFSAYSPFMLDEFLKTYRESKQKQVEAILTSPSVRS